jgi:hypothetical protein
MAPMVAATMAAAIPVRNWGSNQLPIKAPIKMSATRPKRGVH